MLSVHFLWLYVLSDLSFTDRLSDFIVTVSNISFPVTSDQLVSPSKSKSKKILFIVCTL